MRKVILMLLSFFLLPAALSALDADDVTSVNLVTLLSDAGYAASVDEDGDVEVQDQYGMSYYIIIYPDECRLWIQGGWYASGRMDSITAFRLMNECNSNMVMIRGFYEPMAHTFYCDYDMYYSEIGLDDALFIDVVEAFFAQADWFTDYLLSENAI